MSEIFKNILKTLIKYKYVTIMAVLLTAVIALQLRVSYAWFADISNTQSVVVDTAPNGDRIIREAVPIGNTAFTLEVTRAESRPRNWFPGESIDYIYTVTNTSKIPIVFRVMALQDEHLNVDFFDNTDDGFSVNDMDGNVLASRSGFPSAVDEMTPEPVVWGGNVAEYFGYIEPQSSADIKTFLTLRHRYAPGEDTEAISMGMLIKTHIRFDACQADPIIVQDYFGFKADVLGLISVHNTPTLIPTPTP